jgi:hypothetical protein
LPTLNCVLIVLSSRCYNNVNDFSNCRDIRPFISAGFLCCLIRGFRWRVAQTYWHRVWYVFAKLNTRNSLISLPQAAHFVQTLVASYERYYLALQDPLEEKLDQDGKECSNLLVMISELYNFQVISCVLVFDVIRHLLEGDLTEFKVELLLRIMRSKEPYYLYWAISHGLTQILDSSCDKMTPQP